MSLIVLGMHRSGTSLLIGLLGQFGHDLGEISKTTSPLKPTGTQENLQVRKINNLLLNYNNSSWDNPDKVMKTNSDIEKRMTSFADSLNGKWAIKDPRLLFSYHIWEKYLPKHNIIATIRHPLLVAQSLKTKNGMEKEAALKLWLEYNSILLEMWKKKPFPIINFDQAKKQYYLSIKKLETYLETVIDKTQFNKFYQHKDTENINLFLTKYPEIDEVFNQLIKASKQDINYE